MASEGFEPIEEAEKWIKFSRSIAPDGGPNFFRPYIYTYFFGKRNHVLPTFRKAKRKHKPKNVLPDLIPEPILTFNCDMENSLF